MPSQKRKNLRKKRIQQLRMAEFIVSIFLWHLQVSEINAELREFLVSVILWNQQQQNNQSQN
jgi:hypothetical protein